MAEELSVGVLALQGDFREHIQVFARLDVEASEVRTVEDLQEVDGLVIPGGESTAIGRLARIYGLIKPLRKRVLEGMPVLGTCAGMIFLASETTLGEQPQLGVLDVKVERNAFGRQADSFEADLEVDGQEDPVRAVFIRAPLIVKVGCGVDVLSVVAQGKEKRPVFVRQGNILATSFHPELTRDTRVHQMFLDVLEGR